jgi:hypothetical protein
MPERDKLVVRSATDPLAASSNVHQAVSPVGGCLHFKQANVVGPSGTAFQVIVG